MMSAATETQNFKGRDTFLPFCVPSIGQEEIEAVTETLKSPWITTGPRTRQFESDFAAYIGARGALALNSCTAGMHVALVAYGIGEGDEVITTPLTFCATANVVEHVGAKPVFVDVEPDTLNIDPVKIEASISTRTKAIMPVHYAGHPVELDAVNDIAQRHGLKVIEDAAHALPAKFKGRMIGDCENPVAYSFYATKNLTTAEGGMLTGDSEFLARSRVIGLHGLSRDAYKRYDKGGSWFYEVNMPGFKYNMTDVMSAIGQCQLKKLNRFQTRREEIVAKYQNAFGASDQFEEPTCRGYVDHAWHLYILRLNLETLTIDRDQFIEELTARNIGTSVHFIPLHTQPYYRDKYGLGTMDLPVAYQNYLRIVTLPLYPDMTDSDVHDVIGACMDVGQKFRR